MKKALIIILLVILAVPALSMTKYKRSEWRAWIDADNDCQDTRQEILIEQSIFAVKFKTEKQCKVRSGLWIDPYTGKFHRDPSKLHVDHMVPLANAHRSGGWRWDEEKKKEFANAIGHGFHLITVEGRINISKSDKGPDQWRPPSKLFWCDYAKAWESIKTDWGLEINEAEKVALKEMREECH